MTVEKAVPLLKIDGLKKFFPIKSGILQRKIGDVKAVDDINLTVVAGETIGIVGESGCGKSTVGRTIIRLYEPTEGKILYKGKDISHLNESALRGSIRKEIQMIFQDPFSSLNPRKTLGKTLLEPIRAHKLYGDKQTQIDKVHELLNVVGLNSSYYERYPHELSGGQRQRIGIARALTVNPELIIADEAVSALDVSIQAQVINLLKDLQQKFGLTYLFISHDLSVVRHISDRVLVLYLGKMMELADKELLYKKPLHPYTQSLLSAVPVTRGTGKQKRERIVLEGDLPSPSSPPTGCVFHTRCPVAMESCKQEVPLLKEVEPKHFVACHLF